MTTVQLADADRFLHHDRSHRRQQARGHHWPAAEFFEFNLR